MFFKIKENNFICFCKTPTSSNKIELVECEFSFNLLSIDEIKVAKCMQKANIGNKKVELLYQIDFDRFVDDGVLNHFVLYFTNKNDREFKRIKKVIKAITKGE
jgi:hypothetical protein